MNETDSNGPPSKKTRSSKTSVEFNGQFENDDFCRFVISRQSSSDEGDILAAAGTRTGLLYYFKGTVSKGDIEISNSNYIQAHDSDLHCVDLEVPSSLAITGSRDRTVKIWQLPALSSDFDEDDRASLKASLKLADRAWCLKTNRERAPLLAVGSAACWNDCAPVTLWDLER
jgi:WD40 repeat protein